VGTGEVLWLYEWELYDGGQITDPLFYNNKIFIAQKPSHGLANFLIDITGTEPKVLWENQYLCSQINSHIMIDGYIYGCYGGPDAHCGILKCLDVETGEVMWEENLDTISVSLLAADGKLIILEDDGTLRIIKAT
jgi:outer membrane protein assembly factor BamB